MADDNYEVALDGAVSGARGAVSGKAPSEWDAKEVLEASGQAAAAAVCAAYGLAAAAPVCSWVGGKVMGFVADVGEKFGQFFGGLFGRGDPPEPTLIQASFENQFTAFEASWGRAPSDMSELEAAGLELAHIYQNDLELGPAGEYGVRGALEDLKRAGLDMPRTVSIRDRTLPPDAPRFPVPWAPDFAAAFRSEVMSKPEWANMSDAVRKITFSAWLKSRMYPYLERIRQKTAEVALALSEEAIAVRAVAAMREAQIGAAGPGPLREGLSPLRRVEEMFKPGLSEAQWQRVRECVIEAAPFPSQYAQDAAYVRCRAQVLGQPDALGLEERRKRRVKVAAGAAVLGAAVAAWFLL